MNLFTVVGLGVEILTLGCHVFVYVIEEGGGWCLEF